MVLALLSMAALQGCASRLETTVTTFHQAGTSWAGKRFEFVPTERQRDSLEYKAYADRVSQALQAHGLVPAAGKGADVDVSLDYKAIELRPLVYSSPIYGYGSFGPVWGWHPYARYGGGVVFGWQPYWSLGYGAVANDYREYRNWRRELTVRMVPPGGGANQFEATAFHDGASESLPQVMPALVEAIFHDFPGPNGQVRQVLVELRDQSSNSQSPTR